MAKTITIRDHNVPDPYPRRYEPDFDMTPGGITHIDVPSGFYWRPSKQGGIVVHPRWWRRLKHAVTGKW